MRILFCGDRNWTDREKIARAFDVYKPTVVIEGEARGADRLCRNEALSRGIHVEVYPALWTRYGRAAGPIRNTQMLDEGHPDAVVAFHSNISQSKGTADMIRQAEARGITTYLIV